MLKVYGHYVSQPARSLLWLLKMHAVQFEFVQVDPLKGDCKKAEYLQKFPTGLSPAIDDSGYHLAEGPAILQYLCEKNNWDQWYPTHSDRIRDRSKVMEYLSYHHSSTRLLSRTMVFPLLQDKFFKKPWDVALREQSTTNALSTIKDFERIFLLSTPGCYVGGLKHPTIADLIAYPEIAQLTQLGLVKLPSSDFPVLDQWLSNMQSLPMHDAVHQAVFKLAEMVNKSSIAK